MFRVTLPNPPLKVAIAATCLAQPASFQALLADFTLSQAECARACQGGGDEVFQKGDAPER